MPIDFEPAKRKSAIDFEPIRPSGIIDFEPIKRVTQKIDFEPIRKIPIREPSPDQPLSREEIRRRADERRRRQEGLALPEERISRERVPGRLVELPGAPEIGLEWFSREEELRMRPELRPPYAEKPTAFLPIPQREVIKFQVKRIADKMLKDVYGEKELQRMVEGKQLREGAGDTMQWALSLYTAGQLLNAPIAIQKGLLPIASKIMTPARLGGLTFIINHTIDRFNPQKKRLPPMQESMNIALGTAMTAASFAALDAGSKFLITKAYPQIVNALTKAKYKTVAEIKFPETITVTRQDVLDIHATGRASAEFQAVQKTIPNWNEIARTAMTTGQAEIRLPTRVVEKTSNTAFFKFINKLLKRPNLEHISVSAQKNAEIIRKALAFKPAVPPVARPPIPVKPVAPPVPPGVKEKVLPYGITVTGKRTILPPGPEPISEDTFKGLSLEDVKSKVGRAVEYVDILTKEFDTKLKEFIGESKTEDEAVEKLRRWIISETGRNLTPKEYTAIKYLMRKGEDIVYKRPPVPEVRMSGVKIPGVESVGIELQEEVDTFPGINLSGPAFKARTELAKKSDDAAAVSILDTVLKPGRIEQLKEKYGDTSDIIWVPISPLIEGENIIPFAFAKRLESEIGGKAIGAIMATKTRLSLRKIPSRLRLARGVRIDFAVDETKLNLLKGKRVIVIDDQYKTGGTVRDAVKSLATAGIKVSGVQTLGAGISKQFKLSEKYAQNVEEILGTAGVAVVEKAMGKKIQHLTNAEFQSIMVLNRKYKSLEALEYELERINKDYERLEEEYRPEVEAPARVVREAREVYRAEEEKLATELRKTRLQIEEYKKAHAGVIPDTHYLVKRLAKLQKRGEVIGAPTRREIEQRPREKLLTAEERAKLAKPPPKKKAVEPKKPLKVKATTKEVMQYARAEKAALIDEYKVAREQDFIDLIVKGELFHPETGEPADTGLIDPTRKYFGNVPFYKSGEWKRLSPIVQRRLFRKGGADFDVVAGELGMTQVEFLEELIKYKPIEKPPPVNIGQVRAFLEETPEGQASIKEWREIAAVKGMTVEELKDLIAKRKKVRPAVSKKIQTLFEKIRLAKEGEMNLGRIISEESLLDDIIKGQEAAAQRKFAEGKRAGIYQEKERFAEVVTRARGRKGQRERIKKMISDIEKIDLSKITPEEAEPLKALLRNVDLVKRQRPTMLRLGAYKRFIDTHPDAEVPDYMKEKLDRLDKRNMNEITEDELKTIHDMAMHFLHIHETKMNIRVGRQVRNKIKVLFDSIDEMKPEKAVKSTIVRSYKGRWAKLANVGQLIKDTFGIRSEHYDLIIETLAGPNSTMDKVLYRNVKEGIDDQYRFRHNWVQLFQNTLGPEQFKKKYKIKNLNKWLNAEVPVAGFYLSRNERMALYRHSLNKDNTRSLLEVGFGFRTSENPYKIYRITQRDLRAIVDNLDDAEMEFCIKPFDVLENAIVKKLGEVFYEKNNFPMPVEINYYPKNVMTSGMSLEAQDEKAIEQFRQKEALRVGMSKGFLKRRKRVAVPIYVNGFTYDVNNMIFHASAYSGLELPLSNASKLLYDRTFRAEIYRRYGKQTWIEIEKGLRDIVGDWMSYTTTEQLAMKLKNNLSTAILGISWAIPKQILSLAMYNVYIKPQYLISGAADYTFSHADVTNRHNLYSPEWVERIEGGYSRDVADVFKSQAQRGIYRGAGPIKEKLMGGVKLFDKLAVGPGMQAAVSQVLHEFKEGKLSYWVQQALDIKDSDIIKLSPTEKMQQAYKFADWATERTQPMFSPDNRSSMSRGPTVEKIATQFTAFTNQMLNLSRRLWREADRTKDPARYANYLHFLFLLYVVNTGGVFLIHKLRDYIYKRDQRHKRGLLLQFGEAIMDTMLSLNYFIRDLGYSVKSKVKYGTFRGADYSLPILEVPNKMTDIAANGFGYFSERNRYKRKKMAIDFIDDSIALTLMLNGLPYQTPKRVIQKQFLKK